MTLQDITPLNDQLADIIVRAEEPWIETQPGMASMGSFTLVPSAINKGSIKSLQVN